VGEPAAGLVGADSVGGGGGWKNSGGEL